mgnify:CR=1 FL=1
MRVEKDFKELLELFNKHKVKYLIVGAFAVGVHAVPRYTKDMDVLVEPTSKNAQKVVNALKEFGFGSLQLSEADFAKEGSVVKLGYEPVRIDLITSITGLMFEAMWKSRIKVDYDGIMINIIGFDDLVESKRIANRRHDKMDLDILYKMKKSKKKSS